MEIEETAGQMLQRLGMDGKLWAEEFSKTAVKLGYAPMDEGWLIGWFANAIMAGYDEAQRRAAKTAATQQPVELSKLIYRVLNGHKMIHQKIRDTDMALPLVDYLTPEGWTTINGGMEENEAIAEAVAEAIEGSIMREAGIDMNWEPHFFAEIKDGELVQYSNTISFELRRRGPGE